MNVVTAGGLILALATGVQEAPGGPSHLARPTGDLVDDLLAAYLEAVRSVDSFTYRVTSYQASGPRRAQVPELVGTLSVVPTDEKGKVHWRVDALSLPTELLGEFHYTLISSPDECMWSLHEERRSVRGSFEETYDEWSPLESSLMVRELLRHWYAWEHESLLEKPTREHEGTRVVNGVACEVVRLASPESSWSRRLFLGREDHLPRRVEHIDASTDPPTVHVQELDDLLVNELPPEERFHLAAPEGYEVSRAIEPPILSFRGEPEVEPTPMQFTSPSDPYLTRLRERFGLDALVEGCENDLAVARTVCAWAHSRWEHHSSQKPRRPDAISILEEAEAGARFRCVEYSTVVQACLQALGIPARPLNLLRRDIETRRSGGGHVVVEAFLRDRRRWQLVDAQLNVVPSLGGEPLHAAGFQDALARSVESLELNAGRDAASSPYPQWAVDCLYYFRFPFDSRVGAGDPARRPQLLLVPLGAPCPRVFERLFPIVGNTYTHSLADFYAAPDGG